jgi:integrase
MPRSLPKYVRQIKAKGKPYLYFILNRRIVARLPDDPASAAFHEQYAKLLRRTVEPQQATGAPEGSVGWLIAAYKQSPGFQAKAKATQVSYTHELDRLRPIAQFQAADVKRRHINALRNALSATPRTQQLFGSVVSLLWNYGIEECDLECMNPARRMRRAGKATAYKRWTADEMAIFEASNPPRHLMTAYMVARYTGPRRGDCLTLTRRSYDGAGIHIRGAKRDTPNYIRAHTALRLYLNGLPKTLYIIADADGQPVKPDRLSKDMRKHLDKCGLPHLHLHGLRHEAGSALAEAGCTAKEIAAVLGHRTLQMVEKYTHGAEQRRLADKAIIKLERAGEAKTASRRAKTSPPE